MNAKIRKALAQKLAAIAAEHGAETEITHESRSSRVECRFPEVSVGFDLDRLHRGGILASWYNAARNLVVHPFDSINTYHKRKATQYRDNAAEFTSAFRIACAAVADGSAFEVHA